MKLHDLLTVETRNATDTTATLRFHDQTEGQIESVTGTLRGPRCKFSKTLPSMFAFQGKELLVTEPCYWSPRLPFLYEIELKVKMQDGESYEFADRLGINRWEIHQQNLRLEGRRTVLRGGSVPEFDADLAREMELAVFTGAPFEETLREASESGVPLVVDLRGKSSQATQLAMLTWYPAAVLAVFDGSMNPKECEGLNLAQAINAKTSADSVANWADAILVELQPGGRPPSWLSSITKPIFVRQIINSQIDVGEIRNRCDKLQAFLAPEFDCAGYFVG